MPRYLLRVAIPDRPGSLGAVTSALGRLGVNVVGLQFVDTGDGEAVDEFQVDMPIDVARRLPESLSAVPGATVEFLRPMAPHVETLTPLELAADLVGERPEQALSAFVHMLPVTVTASWALAIDACGGAAEVVAASGGAPYPDPVPDAWLPLDRARRLTDVEWPGAEAAELAAAPLGEPCRAVVVARVDGPRFRGHELQELDLLARICYLASRDGGAGDG